MVEYLKCKDCGRISAEGKLSREYVKGTGKLLAYCECGCETFLEVRHICTECERHEAVKDDDLCQLCIDVEKDALADIELTAIEERAREAASQELRRTIINMCTPFRRQA